MPLRSSGERIKCTTNCFPPRSCPAPRSRATRQNGSKTEASQRIIVDPETDARVVCYVHTDGRVLIDAVRIPQPTPIYIYNGSTPDF